MDTRSLLLVATVAALGLLLAEGWLLIHLLGQNGRLLLRLDALERAASRPARALVERGDKPAPAPRPATPAVGDPAPAVSLPDLDGKTVALAAYRGQETMLLFWNPGCGFCKRMLDDLKAWEANPPNGAPKLVVVSTGTAEANAAMGLRSTVLLDQSNAVSTAFGANGTPMAVRIDASGRVASAVAAGASAVFELLGTPQPAGT